MPFCDFALKLTGGPGPALAGLGVARERLSAGLRVVDDRLRVVAGRSRSRRAAGPRSASSTARRGNGRGTRAKLGHVAAHVCCRRGRSAPCGGPGCRSAGTPAGGRRPPRRSTASCRCCWPRRRRSSSRMNQRSPQRQSMPRSLVRNEPDHEPSPVVHPALAAQLAHARRRRAGSRCGPRTTPRRRARRGSSGSPAVALLELRARVAREVQQHVVVEVAPAELAAKRVGACAPRQALLDLARRDAAEVQVGRQARGAVALERVAVAIRTTGRSWRGSARSRSRAGAPRRPGSGSRDLLLQGRAPPASASARAAARWQRRQLAGRGEQLAAPRLPSHARWNGEKTVYGLAPPGCGSRRRRRRRPGRGAPQLDLRVGAAPSALARRGGARTGPTSALTCDRAGSGVPGEPRQLALGRPAAGRRARSRGRAARRRGRRGTRAGTARASPMRGGRAAGDRRGRTPARPARRGRAPPAARDGRARAGRAETRRGRSRGRSIAPLPS